MPKFGTQRDRGCRSNEAGSPLGYDAGVARPEVDLIASVPLFRGLDAAALEVVARDARLVKAASGRSFFREGEPARFFYVVRAGRVKFTQISAEGHEVILRVIGPGEPFGGVAALSEKAVYPVTARALDPCEAHAWDGPKVTALMHRFPPIAINAARMVADRLHELQRQHHQFDAVTECQVLQWSEMGIAVGGNRYIAVAAWQAAAFHQAGATEQHQFVCAVVHRNFECDSGDSQNREHGIGGRGPACGLAAG